MGTQRGGLEGKGEEEGEGEREGERRGGVRERGRETEGGTTDRCSLSPGLHLPVSIITA